MLRPALLFVALAAAPVVAQPSADALLRAWTTGWDEAAQGLESVAFGETLVRTIEGPRGTMVIETRGSVRLYVHQRPRRSVTDAWVNDEPVDLAKRSDMEPRLRHALGRASRDLTRPASLPFHQLDDAEPTGDVRVVRLGATTAWQVSLQRPQRRGPAERMTAWFSTSRSSPRLLRLQRERQFHHNDRLNLVTTYSRIDGLDIPVSHSVNAQIEQRRRLRTYALVLHAEATYEAAEPRWE